MAIGGKCLVMPRDLIELVYTLDSSVDQDTSDLTKYAKTLDRRHLKTDGKETIFHVVPLNGESWEDCHLTADSCGEPGDTAWSHAAALRAFDLAVKRVSHYEISDGVFGDLERKDWKDCLPIAVRLHVGSTVINISMSGLGEDTPKS